MNYVSSGEVDLRIENNLQAENSNDYIGKLLLYFRSMRVITGRVVLLRSIASFTPSKTPTS